VENEPGLRHRAFKGIDQQEHSIGHFEDAFDFTAEIGVAGCINDVDLVILALFIGIVDCSVLGQDCDSALAFKRVRVHDQAVLAACEAVEFLVTEHA
jgi:hypothetical protein